jgi:hypothetical protein
MEGAREKASGNLHVLLRTKFKISTPSLLLILLGKISNPRSKDWEN